MKKLEEILEWGGVKRDITFLVLSGAALLLSILGYSPFPFDMAWVAVILCGIPSFWKLSSDLSPLSTSKPMSLYL